MPRLQRSVDEEQALGEAVPEGWFSFSKQTPNRWALISYGSVEWMGLRRRFTRSFASVIFSL